MAAGKRFFCISSWKQGIGKFRQTCALGGCLYCMFLLYSCRNLSKVKSLLNFLKENVAGIVKTYAYNSRALCRKCAYLFSLHPLNENKYKLIGPINYIKLLARKRKGLKYNIIVGGRIEKQFGKKGDCNVVLSGGGTTRGEDLESTLHFGRFMTNIHTTEQTELSVSLFIFHALCACCCCCFQSILSHINFKGTRSMKKVNFSQFGHDDTVINSIHCIANNLTTYPVGCCVIKVSLIK